MIKNNNVINRCYSVVRKKKKNKKERINDVRINKHIPITVFDKRDNMYVILLELYDILLTARSDVVVDDYKDKNAYDYATDPIRIAKNKALSKYKCSNKKVEIVIETKSSIRKLEIHNKATLDLIINYCDLTIYK